MPQRARQAHPGTAGGELRLVVRGRHQLAAETSAAAHRGRSQPRRSFDPEWSKKTR
jgi:hypothetical protein